MEILSTGEKIKRARMSKGYTLKDLCQDKISVSKMSCIENGKTEAKEWILNHVANILNISPDYLKEDAETQIFKNIKDAEGRKDTDKIVEIIETGLKYAEEHKMRQLAFKLVHMLFNKYTLQNSPDKVHKIIPKYYEIWNKTGIKENEIIYLMDFADFLYETAEYSQAEGCYKILRKTSKKLNDIDNLVKSVFREAACCLKQNKCNEAFELAVKGEKYIDQVEGNNLKAEAYRILTVIFIKQNDKKYAFYESNAYKLLENDNVLMAETLYDFGSAFLSMSKNKEGEDYIKNAANTYKGNSVESRAEFMLGCVEILIEYGIINDIKDICDKASKDALASGSLRLIEKNCYLKSLIFESKNDYASAVHYMNLSLDALSKIGTKHIRCKRHLRYGEMYHRMNNVKEALKHFNMAVGLLNNI